MEESSAPGTPGMLSALSSGVPVTNNGRITRRTALQSALAMGAYGAGGARLTFADEVAPANNNLLWYRQPAEQWTEALPIGNGRLGAVCFGGVERDLFQLSDGTAFGQEPG